MTVLSSWGVIVLLIILSVQLGVIAARINSGGDK